MSRTSSRKNAFMSPAQVRACLTVAGCVVAIVLSFVLAWIVLPGFLGRESSDYDPTLYTVDTSLGAVLPQGSDNGDSMAGTVFVGDAYMAGMQSQNLITLDQFVGAQGLTLASFPRDTCIYFANDANAYTVPQALARMKPRRVVLTLGSSDVSGNYNSVDAFVQAYRQATGAIAQAYPYCDVIVNSIPPVRRNSSGSGARQTTIDQYNQALAAMCQSDGLVFLNSAETLKGSDGFAQDSYFDNATGLFTASGGNALLMYFRQHPYVTQDRRPDTNDIPRRAAQPTAGDTGASGPSPTPAGLSATYTVEDTTRGSLSTATTLGLAQGALTNNVSRLEFDVPERTTVTVTAVPASGWTFVRWSDGVVANPRTDVVMSEMSVVAIFGQVTIEMKCNGSHCDDGQVLDFINVGDSYTFTAHVRADGTEDTVKNSQVEWVVNEQTVGHGASYTFSPTTEGRYDIIIGYVPDASDPNTAISTYITVEVPRPAPPSIAISPGNATATVGDGPLTLTASVQNAPEGSTIQWSCPQIAAATWSPTGASASFPIPATPGTYTVTATCAGATSNTCTVTVNAAPTPEPPAEPTADPNAQQQPPA